MQIDTEAEPRCLFAGKHPCTAFQGVYVAASIQIYGSYIPDKCPCGSKSCSSALGHYDVCEMRLIGQQNECTYCSVLVKRPCTAFHGHGPKSL